MFSRRIKACSNSAQTLDDCIVSTLNNLSSGLGGGLPSPSSPQTEADESHTSWSHFSPRSARRPRPRRGRPTPPPPRPAERSRPAEGRVVCPQVRCSRDLSPHRLVGGELYPRGCSYRRAEGNSCNHRATLRVSTDLYLVSPSSDTSVSVFRSSLRT